MLKQVFNFFKKTWDQKYCSLCKLQLRQPWWCICFRIKKSFFKVSTNLSPTNMYRCNHRGGSLQALNKFGRPFWSNLRTEIGTNQLQVCLQERRLVPIPFLRFPLFLKEYIWVYHLRYLLPGYTKSMMFLSKEHPPLHLMRFTTSMI